jgi:hypothetical protein
MSNRGYLANRDEVTTDQFGAEVFIINFHNGRYYQLRGSGTVIWRLVQSPQTAESIAERLALEFAHLPSDVASNVSDFLNRLETEGLVLRTETQPTAETQDLDVDTDQGYQLPVIEVFDDLAELITIDPLHDVDGERGWPVKPAT